jgi:hypothetical protein
MKVSLNRTQVEDALAKRDTDLLSFVEAGQRQGKSMEEIWMDLRHISGVPFSVRTLYRWADSLVRAS